MSIDERGYALLARGLTTAPTTGEKNITKPGSGSTITIWDSTANQGEANAGVGRRIKRLILVINSSADSGASGVIFEASEDGGANWDASATAQTYLTANGRTVYYVSVAGRDHRVRYTNSAAVLTTWRMVLFADFYERAV